jgi:carbonic anhydrase/SulP family sulfate permease
VGGDVLRIELANQVSFLNRAALIKSLDSVPKDGHVLIDARGTDYIDADVHDLIWEYIHEIAPARSVQVSMIGLKEHYQQLQDRIHYADYTTRDLQSQLTPDQVLQILRDGNERFRTDQRLTRELTRQLESSAHGQHPLAVVFSGASSRTPVEMIFDVGLGDLFCVRVSGNLVRRGVLGSLEYACAVAGAKLIVVMGHGNSAVCRMAIESHVLGKRVAADMGCTNLEPIVQEIEKSLNQQQLQHWSDWDADTQEAFVDRLYQAHLGYTIDRIRGESAMINRLVIRDRVKLVGAMYNVHTGEVKFLE